MSGLAEYGLHGSTEKLAGVMPSPGTRQLEGGLAAKVTVAKPSRNAGVRTCLYPARQRGSS